MAHSCSMRSIRASLIGNKASRRIVRSCSKILRGWKGLIGSSLFHPRERGVERTVYIIRFRYARHAITLLFKIHRLCHGGDVYWQISSDSSSLVSPPPPLPLFFSFSFYKSSHLSLSQKYRNLSFSHARGLSLSLLSFSIHQSVYHAIYPTISPIYLLNYLPTYISFYLSISLSVERFTAKGKTEK